MQVSNTPNLTIYKNRIIYCPKPECKNYLVVFYTERFSPAIGKYRTFKCLLCGYCFSETRHLVCADRKLGSIRNSLRKKHKMLTQIEQDIKILEQQLIHYHEKPELVNTNTPILTVTHRNTVS